MRRARERCRRGQDAGLGIPRAPCGDGWHPPPSNIDLPYLKGITDRHGNVLTGKPKKHVINALRGQWKEEARAAAGQGGPAAAVPWREREIAAEAPKDQEQDERKDTSKDGGAETGRTTASPMTAGSGPAAAHGVMTVSPMTAEERLAAAPAGTTEGPSRGGGGARAGGTLPGTVRTPGRAPGLIAVETTTKPEAGMFGRGAVLEEPPAAP